MPRTSPVHAPGRRSSGRLSTGRCRRSLARRRSSAAAARCRQSFPHRDFENPEAETCWLSCLFQSLWHSAVFHQAFEDYLAASSLATCEDERILAALRQTWEEYKAAGAPALASPETSPEGRALTAPPSSAAAPPQPGAPAAAGAIAAVEAERLVPADDLAEAFGDGYGDMSEALALMQDELSQSSSAVAKRLAELFILVPLTSQGDGDGDDAPPLPGPTAAWALVEEWQTTSSPLIAVDLSLPRPGGREVIRQLAELWVPGGSGSAGAQHPDAGAAEAAADMGSSHRLVCLVCFMWNLQHYVAFCRRQSSPGRCIFFNDLPELTRGAPREANWSDVPETCGRFGLSPRLALYESAENAEIASRDPAMSST